MRTANPAVDRRLAAPGESTSSPSRAVLTLRPANVIRAAVLLLFVGNLGLVPILSDKAMDAPAHVNDVLMLWVLATGLLAGLSARTWRVDTPGLLAVAFAAVGGGSAVLAASRYGLSAFELAFSLAYLARWVAYFGIYLVVINTVRIADAWSIWRALETAVLVIAAFGIVQSVLLPNFALTLYPSSVAFIDYDPQGHRLVSTLLDPNLAGALLAMVLLVQLALLSTGAKVTLWKPLLLFAALMLTLSRGAMLSFVAGAAVVLAVRGLSRRVVKLGALVAVLALPFVPALVSLLTSFNRLMISDPSAMGRVKDWLRGLAVFVDNPVLGIGFNTFGFVEEAYGYQRIAKSSFGSEGGLLFIAVMTGLVGLALYCGMFALILRRCRQLWRDQAVSAEHRGLAVGAAAATVTILVNSLFANSLINPFITEPLWVLWALTFVIAAPPPAPRMVPRGPVVVSLATGVKVHPR